jgi:NitT/TauT family transport system ATP-binding protein
MTADGVDLPMTPVQSVGVGAMLEFCGVRKQFQHGTVAISGVDLVVAPGELVSVVGPSGCGKSTILRIASGLTQPSAGVVSVATDRIGHVFQDPTLLPWRTVAANVELLTELHGLPRDERRRRADEAIKLVGLEGFRGHRPRTLSGGMRMRVSLARSLTMAPELFLFDEPFGPLDAITRQRLCDELQLLYLAHGFAGVFVTHSVTEAVFLAGRVLVMSERPGRIVADIPVQFDYPRPPAVQYSANFARLAREVSECLRGKE